jgi:hypothetical protein
LTNANAATVAPRIDLILDRAAAGEAEVVVKADIAGTIRGWSRIAAGPDTGKFLPDSSLDQVLTDAQLRSLANGTGQAITYTAVPLGTAVRMGVDRDDDGILDFDDNCPGAENSDQADADGDGRGDACDNCLAHNDTATGHRDSNGDGFGNLCDADFNNDNIVNSLDLGMFKQKFLTTDADGDLNGDGLVNSLDLGRFKALFMQPPGPSAFAP